MSAKPRPLVRGGAFRRFLLLEKRNQRGDGNNDQRFHIIASLSKQLRKPAHRPFLPTAGASYAPLLMTAMGRSQTFGWNVSNGWKADVPLRRLCSLQTNAQVARNPHRHEEASDEQGKGNRSDVYRPLRHALAEQVHNQERKPRQ
jgi:hypothetical protein